MCCFFFNDTATTEIYTLSLHDALPIWCRGCRRGSATIPPAGGPAGGGSRHGRRRGCWRRRPTPRGRRVREGRSEEHTSEIQSRQYLVCRLLLEKKKTDAPTH